MPIKNFRPVKAHEDPKVYKDRILSELFRCGAVQEKVKGICFRNFIHKDTHIGEDIVQETFYHLCKTKAEQLIEMYQDEPSRLLGLSVRIAILKGVTRSKNNPAYPKHSVMTNILFASNLNQKESLTATDDIDESPDAYNHVIIDPTTVTDEVTEMFELIFSELSEDDAQFLDDYVETKKGKLTKDYKLRFTELREKIKSIVSKHKIKINE